MNDEKTGDKCRWCIDSRHRKFCCDKHETQYNQIRNAIASELSRKPKQKYTPSQEKAWRDLKDILIGK